MNFVGIVLALSGVEAIANMTGIMKVPVGRTAKRAIYPVLFEVSILTFLLGLAMNAIPNLENHTEDMLRVLGAYYVSPWFGQVIAVLFALLLLSATNSAINGMVSIQFSLAKDREMPWFFANLNRFGMPWLGLIMAVGIPVLVLMWDADIVHLAALYAIGVVGAITLNLGACAFNFNVAIPSWQRVLLCICSVILLCIEITIAFQKPAALFFALLVLGSGLVLRLIARTMFPVIVPGQIAASEVLTVTEAKDIDKLYKSSVLVALRKVNADVLDEAIALLDAPPPRD